MTTANKYISFMAGVLSGIVTSEDMRVAHLLLRASRAQRGDRMDEAWITEMKRMAMAAGFPEARWDEAEREARGITDSLFFPAGSASVQ
jgi:hypothetical protein